MARSGLPKVIFGRLDDEGYINAYASIEDAVEDDGPTRVGRYELITEKTVTKVIEESA